MKDIGIKKKTDWLIDTIYDNISEHQMLIMELD
jgi:hypothetical protein